MTLVRALQHCGDITIKQSKLTSNPFTPGVPGFPTLLLCNKTNCNYPFKMFAELFYAYSMRIKDRGFSR